MIIFNDFLEKHSGFLFLFLPPQNQVECHVDITPSPCAFVGDKKLSLGLIAVGAPVERTVVFKNVGASYTVFRLDECPPACKVCVRRGIEFEAENR